LKKRRGGELFSPLFCHCHHRSMVATTIEKEESRKKGKKKGRIKNEGRG
jgi:hypothetical protein